MGAFDALAGHVRAWDVEFREGGFPPAAAASVTLRLEGQVIGRSAEVSRDPAGDPGVIARAASGAMAEAARRVPIDRDALFEDNLRALGPQIAVTLEIAGPLVPVALREYADAAAEVSPGLDGVAVRMGERLDVMFPGQMLATGTEPGGAFGALVSRLSGDPGLGLKKPAELAAGHGVVFYRFRAVTIAQARGGEGAMFIHRGGRVVRQSEIDAAGLRRWADGMAAFLQRGMIPGPDGSAAIGELNPVTGAVRPETVNGMQMALGALALVRYSKVPGIDERSAASAREGAVRLLESLRHFELSDTLLAQSGPAGIAASAMAAAALNELGVRLPATGGEQGRAVSQRPWEGGSGLVELAARAQLGLREVPADSGVSIRQLVTWSAAECSPESRAEVEPWLRGLFRETPPGQLVSIMPWAGWAEVSLASGEADIPAAVALREMREMLWKHQLRGEALAGDEQDLAGGIAFTAGRDLGRQIPTWQAARPLAFVATMLGDERLTSGAEVPAELSRLLASLRFLRQLSAGEAEGHMYASPERAMWGVRVSVWDQRMPPEATAITLMAVCETLRSLDAIGKRAEGAAPREEGIRSP